MEVVKHFFFFSFRIMNHAEYKLGNIVAVVWFNMFGGKDISAMTAQREKNSDDKAEVWSSGAKQHLSGIDAATCRVLTDLNGCFLVSWHLSEAERWDVAPHAKSLGDASTRVTGIYQVCRVGEQPAQKQQHYVVIIGLYTHSSTAEESAKTQWLLFRQNSHKHCKQLHYLIFSYISARVGLIWILLIRIR